MYTWDELEKKCKECDKCALCNERANVVFGTGNRKAEVLFIGEAPGADEDIKGEPFTGRAGKLLDEMLLTAGLSRISNIYISNIIKCRPPGNRDPQPAERDACIGWLHEQIRLISPKIIVCLGRIAAAVLIGGNLKITRDHGKWYDTGGIKYMALYHPAALLRDPRKKPDTLADLKILEQGIKATCKDTYHD